MLSIMLIGDVFQRIVEIITGKQIGAFMDLIQNFIVKLYKTSLLSPGDYAFYWSGELKYELLPIKSNNNNNIDFTIKIRDWTPFLKSMNEFEEQFGDLKEYYPVVFWKSDELQILGQDGLKNITKLES